MFRFVSKPVPRLTDVEYRACYRANRGDAGDMRDRLRYYRDRPVKESVATMVWDGDVLAAWCLRFFNRDPDESFWEMHVYTKRKYRRRGLGTELVRRARQGKRYPLSVWPYESPGGKALFGPLLDKHRLVSLQ